MDRFMYLTGLGPAFVLLALTGAGATAAMPADAGPLVTIDAPPDGFATHRDTVAVVVSFEAHAPGGSSRNGTGNVSLVELYLDESLIAQRKNPPQNKSGRFDFTVDLRQSPEGNVVVTAVAYQGHPNAGIFRETSIVLVIDRTPPAVTITAPADGTVTTEDSIEVRGTLNGPASVSVAGVEALVDGLEFSATVALREGGRTIGAEAKDAAGNPGVAAVTVVRDTTPPRLAVLSPRPNALIHSTTVTVTGTVQDLVIGAVDAGDCTVEVNGVAAVVRQGGFAAVDVPVAAGPRARSRQSPATGPATSTAPCCASTAIRVPRRGS